MADFKALLAEFTAAVESGDGARLAALFCEDGVYHDGFYGPFQGRAAIADMLETHFWGHAKDFRWEMRQPVCDGDTGYASYAFSYTSTVPGAEGTRVVFEGIGRYTLEDGLIREYTEVFDTGIALTQIAFPPERIAGFLGKAAKRLRGRHTGSQHLPGQPRST